jgi:hypothetical protein
MIHNNTRREYPFRYVLINLMHKTVVRDDHSNIHLKGTSISMLMQTRTLVFYSQVWTSTGRGSHMLVHDPLFYLSLRHQLVHRAKREWSVYLVI